MNKQRLGILFCSLLGMFAVFMPWAHTIIPGLKNLNGMHGLLGDGGWYILALFSIPFFLSFVGKHALPLHRITRQIVISVGLIIFSAIIIEMIRFKTGNWIQVKIASLGWGLYTEAGAGFLLSALAYILKGKSQDTIPVQVN